MNPFSYPKSRHTRRLRPGPFNTYSDYKPFLREEFEKKCVYCRMPDTMKDYEMYGVDHYRPKSVFSELLTTYTNLFYCCNPCNRRKREYWPTRGKVKTHFVPNPCDHEMFAHLRFAGEKVQARTTAGAVAYDLLDLDDPKVVEYRRFILDALALYEGKRSEAVDALEELRRMKVAAIPPADIDDAVASLELTSPRSIGFSPDLRVAEANRRRRSLHERPHVRNALNARPARRAPPAPAPSFPRPTPSSASCGCQACRRRRRCE